MASSTLAFIWTEQALQAPSNRNPCDGPRSFVMRVALVKIWALLIVQHARDYAYHVCDEEREL